MKYPVTTVVDEFATLLLYLPDIIYEVSSSISFFSIESILFKLFAEQGIDLVDCTYVYYGLYG